MNSTMKMMSPAMKSRKRIKLWLEIADPRLFNIRLPYKTFSPGNSTPFAFVADAFFNPGKDIAAWANRSGLKTLCSSIIAALEFRYTEKGPLKARVLAGSEDQAKNLYGYWQNWIYDVLADRLVGEPGRLLTRLNNGDFEILAASQKRVRGAKVQRLYRDELDEIDPEVIGASVGMLASLNGTPARTIDTSTWHHVGGPMAHLVADAPKRGISLHRWNIWETITKCPQERHANGQGCAACKLSAVCLAKAREAGPESLGPNSQIGIASRACGLMAIDDAIKQLSQWSLQQWEAEAECKRPSLGGLVYPQFERSLHVKPDLDFSDDLPIYRAIDWGLNDFVCLWIQTDKQGVVYVVDEYWANDATLADNARVILAKDKLARIEATYCDPAGANRNDQTGYSDVQVFKGMGIPCRYSSNPWATEVRNGINLIRAFLRPAAGRPRLYVAGKCKQLIRAFEAYRLRKVNNEYVDEPIKPQDVDHPLDAIRYLMVNRFGQPQGSAGYMGYA